MIQQIRKHPISKVLSIFLIYCLLLPIVLIQQPVYGQAGPSQSETTGFTLGSTSGMVDEFTGDFSYSIPLLDVDGYPITISYNSNVTMFQDASWVGLGWDLNVGSVSRDMRGIPDDFNGEDKVQRSIGMKDYETDGEKIGTKASFGLAFGDEPFVTGGLNLNFIYGQYMNSYNGKGTTWDFGIGGSINLGDNLSFNGGVGFSTDSQNGVGRNNSIGVGGNLVANSLQGGAGFSASSSFSSRAGLKSTHFGMSYSLSLKDKSVTQKGNTEKISGGGIGMSHGSTYSLGTMTSVPKFDLPRYGSNTTNNGVLTGIVRLTAIQIRGSLLRSDYYFNDLITDNKQVIHSSAFGYYHMGKGQNATAASRPIMDFNRERDSEFSEEMVKLPFSAPTYDFFNISAMGISGSIRGFRNDTGMLQDAVSNFSNSGKNRELETFAGWAAPTGLILGVSYSQGEVTATGRSGEWNTLNDVAFRWNPEERNGIEKNVFFKAVGEPTPKDMSQWNTFKGDQPLQPQMFSAGDNIFASGNLTAFPSGTTVNAGDLVTTQAPENIRANYYQPHTAEVYKNKFEKHSIPFQSENEWISPTEHTINRVDQTLRKPHHISALEAVSGEGRQYFFDIPVYSIEQSDVVFNASGLSGRQDFNSVTNSGNVTYIQGLDNSWNNVRGRTGFYEKVKTPGYAHSYLLSLLTSSNYIDRTGDGPSTDDFGDYYKFNYTRIYGENNPYKWRFPYEKNSAKLTQGHYSTPFDDVATYSYGEKEIWYAKSIETKNYIVEFHLNDPSTEKRKDGYGVLDENGGLDASHGLRYLSRIVLYNRNDRINNGENAVPLKVVSFKYDYSLCPGTPSNSNTASGISTNSGKLTLRSIHFSGGNSQKGKLAPYEFKYSSGDSNDNPGFSYINVDRWGNFKKNSSVENNLDYPYAIQDEGIANSYSKAWKLKEILTPSYGKVSVDYEADRYTHTQDKRVMNRFKVLGVTTLYDLTDSGFSTASNDFISGNRKIAKNVLFFELDPSLGPITGTANERRNKILNLYFKSETGVLLNEIFFQFRTKVNPNISDSYENVLGFCEITRVAGVVEHNGTQIGYICLKSVDIKDKEGSSNYKVNPIQKAAWQYARLNVPDAVYGNCNFSWSNPQLTNCDFSNDIDAAVAFGSDLNKQLNKKGYCHTFDLNHSFIRLYDPRGYKFGGNARVKSITYSDNWSQMTTTEETSEYTWEYSYDHFVSDRQGNVPQHKSGIAAYEPALGNVLNPFYKWSTYKNEIKQFPDETRFTVEPVGELLFPAPVVGYPQVTVRFKAIAGVTQNTVGVQTTEYLTAKDKPTIVKTTPINNSARVKRNNLFTSEEVVLQGLSQGYTVVTNDFHGKIKSSVVFDRDGNEVQKSNYVYSDNNQVLMLDRAGKQTKETIATEYDIYADSRFIKTESKTMTIGGGAELTWYFPLPIVPLPIFNYSQAKTTKGFFAQVVNKHINQSAILQRVETTYLGSKNSAENLVWDKYSGVVIVSSLNDEFNDKLYSVSYPAHWYYPNMENRYINEDFTITNATLNSGSLQFGGTDQSYLVPGDVLIINNSTDKGWALSGGIGGTIINQGGIRYNSTNEQVDVQLFKSGRRNRLSETMMQVTTKKNPVQGSGFVFPMDDILSVGAVEYDFNYDIPCFTQHGGKKPGKFDYVVSDGKPVNPFTNGLMGNPYVTKQLAYQSERDPIISGIRNDSRIANYRPFYALSNEEWFKIYEDGHPDFDIQGNYHSWRVLQEVDRFDEYSKVIGSRDPLGINSAVLYGYNKRQKLLPIAQAVNAQTSQIVFESFDDNQSPPYYVPELTAYTHFNFFENSTSGLSITQEEKHSGISSLRIERGTEAFVKRMTSVPCKPLEKERIETGEYYPAPCDCIQQFSPLPGEYILSTWVKRDGQDYSYTDIEVVVTIGGATVYTLTPSGPMLEGWQKVEGYFTIPDQQTSIIVSINNNVPAELFIDDFRIHPVHSEVSTTVYDPDNLLPIATHDGNNFTTFYNYDENNQLVRVRVETVEGIKTISETQTGIRKRYTGN